MKILAFSDLHCDKAAAAELVRAAKTADLVIGAGDFAMAHNGLERTMDAIRPFEAKSIFVVGNNETLEALRSATDAPILHGETTEIEGIKIAGIGAAVPPLPPLPWQSFDISEDQAKALLDPIEDADVLVCHSPPFGIGDKLEDGRRVGSTAIRAAIERLEPTLAFCGHIHGCWGERGMIGRTQVANLGPTVNWFEI